MAHGVVEGSLSSTSSIFSTCSPFSIKSTNCRFPSLSLSLVAVFNHGDCLAMAEASANTLLGRANFAHGLRDRYHDWDFGG